MEAFATDIDLKERSVTCFPVTCDNEDEECDPVDEVIVNYDRLVFTIGAITNTYGIPGVKEHCSFLKEIQDARAIHAKLVN